MRNIREFFVSSNVYWDMWFKKFFAQLISVKVWFMATIVILLCINLITSAQFAALFGAIIGVSGFFDITDNIFTKKSDLPEDPNASVNIERMLKR